MSFFVFRQDTTPVKESSGTGRKRRGGVGQPGPHGAGRRGGDTDGAVLPQASERASHALALTEKACP